MRIITLLLSVLEWAVSALYTPHDYALSHLLHLNLKGEQPNAYRHLSTANNMPYVDSYFNAIGMLWLDMSEIHKYNHPIVLTVEETDQLRIIFNPLIYVVG